jgi:GxxExxY protein
MPNFLFEEITHKIIGSSFEVYNPKHEAQLINYFKATRLKVGLLINFGANECKPKRIVN